MKKRSPSLQHELAELERSDPEVRAARANYDASVKAILANRIKPPAPKLAIVTKCQVAGCDSTEAHARTYYAKDYQGPCGDSFCYGSCDMSACREQRAVLCEKHYEALSRDTSERRGGSTHGSQGGQGGR